MSTEAFHIYYQHRMGDEYLPEKQQFPGGKRIPKSERRQFFREGQN